MDDHEWSSETRRLLKLNISCGTLNFGVVSSDIETETSSGGTIASGDRWNSVQPVEVKYGNFINGYQ